MKALQQSLQTLQQHNTKTAGEEAPADAQKREATSEDAKTADLEARVQEWDTALSQLGGEVKELEQTVGKQTRALERVRNDLHKFRKWVLRLIFLCRVLVR
eukprot:2120055-Rhodomonas_salina.2